jgi:hypothetical protein
MVTLSAKTIATVATVNSDPRAMREGEDGRRMTRGAQTFGVIACRESLNGLLKYYRRAAALLRGRVLFSQPTQQ